VGGVAVWSGRGGGSAVGCLFIWGEVGLFFLVVFVCGVCVGVGGLLGYGWEVI